MKGDRVQLPEVINPKPIDDELIDSYMLYSMSVIVGRAIPDVRDGLKPVQRRILYAMYELGLRHNQPYKKSARIIGEVMGKFHPHGEGAIYDALVRMAQPFVVRYTLVQGQGNFGSIDRDPPAAMRYTEARLAALSEELLQDIDRNTVRMISNFDGSLLEPDVLPSKAPQLLMNGSSGIAVGMMTSIPPHNLSELVGALTMLIDDPEVTVQDLMKRVKGPDFPTGGVIMGTESLKEIYEEGKGRVVVRGVAEIEEIKGQPCIVISQIPYNVAKADLVEQIANLTQTIKDLQIRNIRDESDRRGMRVVIELKRGADPNVILNLLYKHSNLQNTFSVNMLAIDHRKQPRLMNLKELLEAFIKHRQEVIRLRTEFELEKALKRAHIVEGLTKACRSIDTVVDIIRNSRTTDEACTNLMEALEITKDQADAILDLRLGRLTSLEIEKLGAEYRELVKRVSEFRVLLSDDKNINGVIISELQELEAQYGDERRTKLSNDGELDLSVQDMIHDDDILVLVTNRGYIKSTTLDSYHKQRRGGMGVKGLRTSNEDFVSIILATSRLSKTVIITSKGKAYVLDNHLLESTSRDSKGKLLANYIRIDPDESVQAVLSIRKENVAGKFLVVTTRQGKIKRTAFEAFLNTRVSGVRAITLSEEDRVVDASISSSEDDSVVISTSQGMVIRFQVDQVRPMGRTAAGVIGIRLKEDDFVVAADVVDSDDTRSLLSATEKGFGKRTPLKEYRLQRRGGMGLKNIYGIHSIGRVVSVLVVSQDDEVLLATRSGMSIRIPVSQVRETKRITKGVRIVNLKSDDVVASLAVIADHSESQES